MLTSSANAIRRRLSFKGVRKVDDEPLRSVIDPDEDRTEGERKAFGKVLILAAVVICLFAVLGRFF